MRAWNEKLGQVEPMGENDSKERLGALLKRQEDMRREIWELEGRKSEFERSLCQLLCEKKENDRKIREIKREIDG